MAMRTPTTWATMGAQGVILPLRFRWPKSSATAAASAVASVVWGMIPTAVWFLACNENGDTAHIDVILQKSSLAQLLKLCSEPSITNDAVPSSLGHWVMTRTTTCTLQGRCRAINASPQLQGCTSTSGTPPAYDRVNFSPMEIR
jgi:hypothetical protein